MAKDFGLFVGRYNTSTPTLTADNDLREMRLDSGGRLYTRLADDRDEALRYFYDGESVNGTPNTDRGILILGKNDTDSNYQAFKLNDDGSLAVSFQSGTDVSSAADADGSIGGPFAPADTVGEIALTEDVWIKIHEIAVATGTLHIDGFSYGSDKNTIFQLVMSDDTGADGHVRADAVELVDTMLTTSSRPSDHVSYSRQLDKAGGTNIAVALYAKQLQSGTAGVAWGMINAHVTT